MFWWFLLAFYGIASLLAFAFYAYDKYQAKKNAWRVPEKTLHWLAFFGGWPGAFLAQRVVRHKRHKASFMKVYWLIVASHLILWGAGGYFYYEFLR